MEEKTWRLKSRVVWLKEGDNNSKYFHRYAQERKAQNTIGEIKNCNGELVSAHPEMAEAGVGFFSTLFKENLGCPIEENFKVVGLFPNKIMEDMNKFLPEKVSEKETLVAFQKSKSSW
jgi:hypothetical protein